MPLAFRCVLMFGIGKHVWKFYCLVPCLLCAFSGCSFACAAPTAEQSAIIAEQTKVIEANPKDYKAYFRRGRAYFDAAQYSEADADCKSGLRINPESQHLWVLQANISRKLGDHRGALTSVKRAQDSGPKSLILFELEVICLRQLRMDKECYARCTELLRTYPECAELYFSRGLAGKSLGRSRDGVSKDLELAVKLAPKNKDYRNLLNSFQSSGK